MKIKKRSYNLRRSGRTYRMLKEAYITAVTIPDCHVIIITLQSHFKMMQKDIEQLDKNLGAIKTNDNCGIRFFNGNYIQVGDISFYKRGIYSNNIKNKLFFDHHVIENDHEYMYVINQYLKWNDVDKFKSSAIKGKTRSKAI